MAAAAAVGAGALADFTEHNGVTMFLPNSPGSGSRTTISPCRNHDHHHHHQEYIYLENMQYLTGIKCALYRGISATEQLGFAL